MNQTKLYSIIESITQTIIGILTSILIQVVLYPLLGIPVTLNQNLIITAVFLVVSIIRGFLIRRLFNKMKN
jgi:uncharacterized membrane protein